MGDERKQQSIRAARDWLDEADASLSRGSGLKGDLKVMLAKAELQRAEEAEPPTRAAIWRRRVLRVVPLTAAAVIVALAWFLTPAVAPPETAGIPSRPQELVTSAPQEERVTDAPTISEEATSEKNIAPVPETSGTNYLPAPAEKEREEPSTVTNAEPRAAAVESPDVIETPAAPPAAPAVPAPETQKLMQSAGKALRQP